MLEMWKVKMAPQSLAKLYNDIESQYEIQQSIYKNK